MGTQAVKAAPMRMLRLAACCAALAGAACGPGSPYVRTPVPADLVPAAAAGPTVRIREPQPITTQTSRELMGVYAPDGRSLAYIGDQSGNPELYLLNVVTGIPERLTRTAAAESSPVFSPDGRRLAYVTAALDTKGDVAVIDLPTRRTRVYDDRARADREPAFLDNRTLLYAAAEAGGAFHLVTRPVENHETAPTVYIRDGFAPTISPDFSALAFTRVIDGRPTLMYADLSDRVAWAEARAQKVLRPEPAPPEPIVVLPGDEPQGGACFAVGRDGVTRLVFARRLDDREPDGVIDFDDPATLWSLPLGGPGGRAGTGSCVPGGDLTAPFVCSALTPLTSGRFSAMFPTAVGGTVVFTAAVGAGLDVWRIDVGGQIPDPAEPAELFSAAERTRDFADRLYLLRLAAAHDTDSAAKARLREAALQSRRGDRIAARRAAGLVMRAIGGPTCWPEAAPCVLARMTDAREAMLAAHPQPGMPLSPAAAKAVDDALGLFIGYYDHTDRRVQATARLRAAEARLHKRERTLALRDLNAVADAGFVDLAAEARVSAADVYAVLGDTDAEAAYLFSLYGPLADAGDEVLSSLDERLLRIAYADRTPADAAVQLRRFIDANPGARRFAATAEWRIALDLEAAGRPDLALDAVDRLLRLYPEAGHVADEARLKLADLTSAAGSAGDDGNDDRTERALESLARIRREVPADSLLGRRARSAWTALGLRKARTREDRNEPAAALDAYNAVIAELGTDRLATQAHRRRIALTAAAGRLAPVAAEYRSLAAQNPRDAVAAYAVALAAAYGPDLKAALPALTAALDRVFALDGTLVHAHVLRGWLYEMREFYLNEKKQGHLETAIAAYETAHALHDKAVDPQTEADLLLNLGNAYYLLNNRFDTAYRWYRERAAAAIPIRDPGTRLMYHLRYGRAAVLTGRIDDGLASYRTALDLARSRGDKALEADLLDRMAFAYGRQGDAAQSARFFAQAGALHAERGRPAERALHLRNEGIAALENGDAPAALAKLDAAAEALRTSGTADVPLDLILGGAAADPEQFPLGFGPLGERYLLAGFTAKLLAGRGLTDAAAGALGEKARALDELDYATGRGRDELRSRRSIVLADLGAAHAASGDLAAAVRAYTAAARPPDGLTLTARTETARSFRNRIVNTAAAAEVQLTAAAADNDPAGALCTETIRALDDLITAYDDAVAAENAPLDPGAHAAVRLFYTAAAVERACLARRPVPARPADAPPDWARTSALNVVRNTNTTLGRIYERLSRAWAALESPERRADLDTAPIARELAWRAALLDAFAHLGALAGDAPLCPVVRSPRAPSAPCDDARRAELAARRGPFAVMLDPLAALGPAPAAVPPLDDVPGLRLLDTDDRAVAARIAAATPLDRAGDPFAAARAVAALTARMATRAIAESSPVDLLAAHALRRRFDERESLFAVGPRFAAPAGDAAFAAWRDAGVRRDAERDAALRRVFDGFAGSDELAFAALDAPERRAVAAEAQAALRAADEVVAGARTKFAAALGSGAGDRVFIDLTARPAALPDGAAGLILGPAGDIVVFDAAGARFGRESAGPGVPDDPNNKKSPKTDPRLAPSLPRLDAAAVLYVFDLRAQGREDDPAEWSFHGTPLGDAKPTAYVADGHALAAHLNARNRFDERTVRRDGPPAGVESEADPFDAEGVLVLTTPLYAPAGRPHATVLPRAAGAGPFTPEGAAALRRDAGRFVGRAAAPVDGFQPFAVVDRRFRSAWWLAARWFARPSDALRRFAAAAPAAAAGVPTIVAVDAETDEPTRALVVDTVLQLAPTVGPAEAVRRARVAVRSAMPERKGPIDVRVLGFAGFDADGGRRFAAETSAPRRAAADALAEAKRWPEAAAAYEEVLRLMDVAQSPEARTPVWAALVKAYDAAGDAARAWPYQEKLVAEQQAAFDASAPADRRARLVPLVQGKQALVALLQKAKRYARALEVNAQLAVLFAGADRQLAGTAASQGVLHELAGEYEPAKAAYERAAALYEKTGQPDLVRRMAVSSARVYRLRLSNPRAALAQLERALAGDAGAAVRADVGLERARALQDLGRYRDAAAVAREIAALAADERDKAEGTARAAWSQRSLSARMEELNLHWRLGEYDAAIRKQQSVFDDAAAGGFTAQQIQSLNLLGLVYGSLGRFDEAEKTLLRVADIAKQINDPVEIATNYHNRAMQYRSRGEFARAVEFFDTAVQLDTKLASDAGLASDYANRALTLQRMGRWDDAVASAERGIELSVKVGNPLNLVRAGTALGLARLGAGNRSAGEADLRRALDTALQYNITDWEWRTRLHLARALGAERREEARALLNAAVDAVERMPLLPRTAHAEVGDVARYAVYDDAVEMEVDAGRHEAAFAVAQRERNRDLLDALGDPAELPLDAATRVAADAVRSADEAFAGALDAYNRATGDDKATREQALDAARRARDAALDAADRARPGLARLLAVRPAGVAALRAGLAPDTTLVVYYAARNALHAWTFGPGGAFAAQRVVVRRSELDERVDALNRRIDAQLDPAAAAAALAQAMGPALPAGSARRLVVVPHGPLYRVPFAVLPVGDAPLVDRVVLTVTDDVRNALGNARTAPAAGVVGFAPGPGRAVRRDAAGAIRVDSGMLPWIELEAADTSRAAARFVRAQTPSRFDDFAALARSADVVHFAGHAYTDPDVPMGGRILFAGADGRNDATPVRRLFADRARARLLVLSACAVEAKSRDAAEAAVLETAVMFAGYDGLVASRRAVLDLDSALFAKHFYRAFAGGRPADEAVREAQLALRRHAPHPSHWAGFTYAGRAGLRATR